MPRNPPEALEHELPPSIDRSDLARPSAAMKKFVDHQVRKLNGLSERRQAGRYATVLEVVVVPLDERLKPTGRAFVALSRDISTGGMCMVHTRPATSTRLFCEITRPNEPPLKLLLHVRRNRRVGSFYEIAGEFVARGEKPAQGRSRD